MEENDILYLSDALNDLTGIPVRVYKNNKLVKLFSQMELSKDPFLLHLYLLEEKHEKNIHYCSTNYFFYYCFLMHQDYKIIVGPFRSTPINEQDLHNLAFDLGINKEDYLNFASNINAISNLPLSTVLKSLIAYNFALNKEKLSLEDVVIKEEIIKTISESEANKEIDNELVKQARSYSLDVENQIANLIAHGDKEGFEKWLKNAPAINAGKISNDYIRQEKNTFITSATLFSRAAIRGGLDFNSALDISDSYILRSENMNSYEDIYNLTVTMIKTYIEKVARLRGEKSYLSNKIGNYLFEHISEKITLDELSDLCYMSKSNLCKRFKEETGLTINEFIVNKRLEEGKRLLKQSNKSIATIAFYLGFSSQAHFSKAFKDAYNISPIKYRNE